jgi:hypothetical protein
MRILEMLKSSFLTARACRLGQTARRKAWGGMVFAVSTSNRLDYIKMRTIVVRSQSLLLELPNQLFQAF